MRRRNWATAAAVLVVVAIVAAVLFARGRRNDAALYRTEQVQRGEVRLQVTATGTLNAMTTVQVGSQISGTIDALHADFNSQVKQGQLLAQIDPTFLKAQVAQNEADLEKAQVTLRQAERDYARQSPLRDQGLASQAEIDAAETALEASRASVKSAEAALERAKTNLRYATILSPIDGIVVSRNVDVGQTVAASLQAPTLFTIANDLTQMQLEASVDEADIGMIEVGQMVTFTVDAYPERVFRGTVQQIRLSPTTDQNVVSYTVIVHVGNPEQRLLPGMTANATFQVAEALNVLKVPSAALRFHPGSKGAQQRTAERAQQSAPEAGRQLPSAEARQRPSAEARQRPPQGEPLLSSGGSGGTPASMERRGSAQGSFPQPAGGDATPRAKAGTVYVLSEGGRVRSIAVRTGISDGTYTAVESDSLADGMAVIVGMNRGNENAAAQGTVNPFAPGGPRRDRR